MSGDAEEVLAVMEVILTAAIFNQNPSLSINDLTPVCREIFSITTPSDIKRPVYVSDGVLNRVLGVPAAHEKLASNAFVTYDDFGQRLRIPAIGPAAEWFYRHGGQPYIGKNPVLALYFEELHPELFSYSQSKEANPRYEDTRAFLDQRISKMIGEDEKLRGALDLVISLAPEEVEQGLEEMVCTDDQKKTIAKIQHALAHRDFLRRHRIYEIGKLLFVGPPGTGKTSLALAMSRTMHMPVLEVRLSMVTSQYLGETSKNIDRIFELAKKLSPSILFIDEFDFVAKSRVSDDHGAMKRAVNSLLKNIDKISLVRNGVILIGATNHPQLLDEAAWRRFDEVVGFSLPDTVMRTQILSSVMASIPSSVDCQKIAEKTEGFSGSDLRMMVKEAILSAIMDKRQEICKQDIEKGILMVKTRDSIRQASWM
jgi:hypothetical protein